MRERIGKSGIEQVAKSVRASSEAQILVREHGATAIEALHMAKNDIAAARKAIAAMRSTTEGSAERLRALKKVDDPAKVEESLRNDEAFARRKRENETLLADEARLKRDLQRAGISTERLKLMREGDPTRAGDIAVNRYFM